MKGDELGGWRGRGHKRQDVTVSTQRAAGDARAGKRSDLVRPALYKAPSAATDVGGLRVGRGNKGKRQESPRSDRPSRA